MTTTQYGKHSSGVPHHVEHSSSIPQSVEHRSGIEITLTSKPYSPPGTAGPKPLISPAGPPSPPPNSAQGLISCPHFPLSTSKVPPALPPGTTRKPFVYTHDWQDVPNGVT